ncbi:phosphoesterase PA-phosphatase relted protein [Thermoanaerobacterium xylanolyticum LX-11]|uniref:Phosphoesterase PA-phosphatase relted protein n=1 Tax=Thermoanaerobacterium xylanolyticum (strain ATCC 49914 / DSM 7097 / LX-11) TaxID=858215 RepID=F6BJY0_THEXL|nr:undecaprenyl-diphosphatase [Thermoanaerobacterium xylanolyticum]AEF18001.1 phosphoesterase PA-phosphatase relted protein [Thermoanaerobacterium xylanolyticum LX-11]
MNYAIFQFINGFAGHHSILDKVMIFIALYSPIIYGLIMVIQWFIGEDDGKKVSMEEFFAAVIALSANFIISRFYFEPRPFVTHKVNLLIKHPSDASFPSDHLSGGSAIAFTQLKGNKFLGATMMVLTVLLLIARVYVGVHYPVDVVAGFVIGFLSSKLVKYLKGILDPLENQILKIWHRFIKI